MRNLRNIESPAPKRFKFTQLDLEKAFIDGIPPKILLCPFQDSSNINLNKLQFPVTLIGLCNTMPINILEKSFGCENTNIIKNLSIYLISKLWDSFKSALEEWSDYIKDNVETFCRKNVSRSNWIIYNHASKTPIKYMIDEQKMWILYSTIIDKEENIDLIEAVRDSIIPWINPKLWSDVEKHKVAKHDNVAFNRQRKAMVEADSELPKDLDVIL